MYSKHHIVLSGVIAAVMILATFASVVSVAPANAQTTPLIVGQWQRSGGASELYTMSADGSATSFFYGVEHSGSWTGSGYQYTWTWDYGPDPTMPGYKGKFVDQITIDTTNVDHLTGINNYGDSIECTRVNTAPTAKISYDGREVAGEQISYSAAQSTDPDDPFNSLTFDWTITGPDGRSDVVSYDKGSTATSSEITWEPQIPGDYVVTLTVTDPSGQSDSDIVTIHISSAVTARVWLEETTVANQYVLHWYITNDGSQPASVTMKTLIHGAEPSLPGYVFWLTVKQNLRVTVVNGDSFDYTTVLKASKHEAHAARAYITSFESALVVKSGAYTYSHSPYDQELNGWLLYYGKWQWSP